MKRLPSRFLALLGFCVWHFCAPHSAAEALSETYFTGDLRLRLYHGEVPVPVAGRTSDARYEGAARARLRGDTELFDRVHLYGSIQLSASKRESADSRSRTALGPTAAVWRDIAFLPLSLEVGRSVYRLGDGFVVSDKDAAWLLDGATLRYDALPAGWELTAVRVPAIAPDAPIEELAWLAHRFDSGKPLLGRIESFAGVADLRDDGGTFSFFGFTARLYEHRTMSLSLRTAGEAGEGYDRVSLAALAVEGELVLTARDRRGQPFCGLRSLFASGDEAESGKHLFVPLLHHERWGQALSPDLSNLAAVNAYAGVNLPKEVNIRLDVMHFRQAEASVRAASTGRFNNGGYTYPANGTERELGTEIVFTVRTDIAEGLEVACYGARFFPGAAYDGQADGDPVDEVRCQVEWVF